MNVRIHRLSANFCYVRIFNIECILNIKTFQYEVVIRGSIHVISYKKWFLFGILFIESTGSVMIFFLLFFCTGISSFCYWYYTGFGIFYTGYFLRYI